MSGICLGDRWQSKSFNLVPNNDGADQESAWVQVELTRWLNRVLPKTRKAITEHHNY